MPSNTGRLSAKLDGFWITKNPAPLIAMKVPIEEVWMSPCTALLERERLRAQPRHRGGESAEDTHDIISNSVPGGRPEGSRHISAAPSRLSVASRVPDR